MPLSDETRKTRKTFECKTEGATTIVEGLLTIRDLERILGRTELTIQHYRRSEGLPCIVIPGDARPTVRFRRSEVLAWARERGKEVYLADAA